MKKFTNHATELIENNTDFDEAFKTTETVFANELTYTGKKGQNEEI